MKEDDKTKSFSEFPKVLNSFFFADNRSNFPSNDNYKNNNIFSNIE